MSEFIHYRTDVERTQFCLLVENDGIWLIQNEIPKLIQTIKKNISLNSKKIFEDGNNL